MNNELLPKLKELRLKLAREEGVPAFCVFSDKVLVRMAELQPTTYREMIGISGVGDYKYGRYGEKFINVILEFKGKPESPKTYEPSINAESKTVHVHTTYQKKSQTSKVVNTEKTAPPVKKKRETYVMNGETYYLIKGKWYNSSFTSVSKEEMYDLNAMRVKNINFDDVSYTELINLAQEMKDSEDYIFSKKLIETRLERSSDRQVIRSILPRYTSILRNLEQPREAIDVAEQYMSLYSRAVFSPALFTSLAGAYCDIGDWMEARKKANVAMAMGNGNASVELQSVYARIKAMER